MRRFFGILVIVISLFFSQKISAQTFVKINLAGLPIGMINAGAEAKIAKHFTLQPEFFISPWASFFGNKLQIYNFNLEGRYYFKESFEHFYVGTNLGIAFFDLQKWNYLNTNSYQRGYSILMGVTFGYQYQLKERLNLDLYIGGANSQGFYHGYNMVNGERYEEKSPWNRSGEMIPYKIGVMLSYKLK